jgi:hypothetical protein
MGTRQYEARGMSQIQGIADRVQTHAGGGGATAPEVALWRLYALRIFFALIAVGQGSIQLPLFFHHVHWTLMSGVAHTFLLTLALLSFVGIRYPLQMLPLMIYELLWKLIWLFGIWLPAWLAGQVDADMHQSFFEIAPIVVVIPFIPWGYVFANYVRKPGDRWTRSTTDRA